MTNPADLLKYAAALLAQRVEWTTDEISGSMCSGEHQIPLDAICDAASEIAALASQCGDTRRYSDGRHVRSSREIESGVITEHVWHPDPAAEQPSSWRGALRHDPGVPSPGVYEVTLAPVTQEILVRVVRTA